MAINLSKRNPVNLNKISNNSHNIVFYMGLSWEPIGKKAASKGLFSKFKSIFESDEIEEEVDLDASCVKFSNKKADETIYFGNLRSRNGDVIHSGDNRTGKGSGDDETISIFTEKFSSDTAILTINSFSGQNFNRISGAKCTIYDQSKTPIAVFNIDKPTVNFNPTAMIVGKLSMNNGIVEFDPIGEYISQNTRTVNGLDLSPYM